MASNQPKPLEDTAEFEGGPQLVIRWPDGEEQNFPLGHSRIIIGRGEDCDIKVPPNFQSISRRHLAVDYQNRVYIAIDLESTNGVFLNEERMQASTPLGDGDELELGDENGIGSLRIRFFGSAESVIESMGALDNAIAATDEEKNQVSGRSPFLVIRWPGGRTTSVEVGSGKFIVGRSEDADLRIPKRFGFVSARQFEIQSKDKGFEVMDLDSTNGTRLNNLLLPPRSPVHLPDGGVLRIGDENFGVSIGFLFQNPYEKLPVGESWLFNETPTKVWEQEVLVIGRLEDVDITLPFPNVSRRHAEIRRIGESYILKDLNSSNGTFLNGKTIQTAEIADGDLIEIGGQLLLFQSGKVNAYVRKGMRVDVKGLTKEIAGSNRQLHPIDMTILPGEFVCLVGPEGGGKSTFIRALTGESPGSGTVRLNGRNFYKEYARYRNEIGFVDKTLTLNKALSVQEALEFAARLRLPGDLSGKERAARIQQVLQNVSLPQPEIHNQQIGSLTKADQKRVQIASELLSDPKLIYLDELTTELDPGQEKKLMHTLRRLADEGRTVILSTQATPNIAQADSLAFLSGGRLIFFGTAQEALMFFSVPDFADIYEQAEGNARSWEKVFKIETPQYYQRNVVERGESLRKMPGNKVRGRRSHLGHSLAQFLVIAQRSTAQTLKFRSGWIRAFLLLPIFGLIQLFFANKHVLTGDPAIMQDPATAALTAQSAYLPFPAMSMFLFWMSFAAFSAGMLLPIGDMVGERRIFIRERMVNLGIPPFLSAKILVYLAIGLIQVFLYMLVISLLVEFPSRGKLLPGSLEISITLLLTMLAGSMLSLFVSTLSGSKNRAFIATGLILAFHAVFSGGLISYNSPIAEGATFLAATRWSGTALGISTQIDKVVSSSIICSSALGNNASGSPCLHYPEAASLISLPTADSFLAASWAILIWMIAGGIMLAGLALWRLKRA